MIKKHYNDKNMCLKNTEWSFLNNYYFSILTQGHFFLLFLESGREEGGDKEKHRTCNPGTHPGQETKPKITADALTTEQSQQGQYWVIF